MEELLFDEDEHKYTVNGMIIPSVTQIMSIITDKKYESINESYMENARTRGTAVHFAIEVYNKTKFLGIEDEYKGYLNAYLKWIKDFDIDTNKIISETKTYNKALWYAGTVDLIYNDDTIIDIKTTNTLDTKDCAVQLSAYQRALNTHGYNIKDNRYILWLKEDGTYKYIKLEDRFNVFLSCIQINNFLKEN